MSHHLQIGAQSLSSALAELGELAGARVHDGLHALTGLLADGHRPVQVLVHEQPHEHLTAERDAIVTQVTVVTQG